MEKIGRSLMAFARAPGGERIGERRKQKTPGLNLLLTLQLSFRANGEKSFSYVADNIRSLAILEMTN